MKRLVRFLRLPRKGKLELMAAVCLVVAAVVMIRLLPFRAWKQWAGERGGLKAPPQQVAEIAWAIMAAARFVPGATCLPQALAAAWWLHRFGYGCHLRLGVARAGEEFRAHAWLESGGQVLIGGEESPLEYVALVEASRS
ncbi:MAG TPA: lasso peptide biosynthesis B2 protein [Terriglobales bacterium]|nr:lasso peptide biosynthesis B2 protein [Terriglobales bacterium]